jgi:hypothetical protein
MPGTASAIVLAKGWWSGGLVRSDSAESPGPVGERLRCALNRRIANRPSPGIVETDPDGSMNGSLEPTPCPVNWIPTVPDWCPHWSGGFGQGVDTRRLRLARRLPAMVLLPAALTRAQPPLATRQAPAPSTAFVLALLVLFEGEALIVAAFSSSANASNVASANSQGSSTMSGHTTKPKSMWSR